MNMNNSMLMSCYSLRYVELQVMSHVQRALVVVLIVVMMSTDVVEG